MALNNALTAAAVDDLQNKGLSPVIPHQRPQITRRRNANGRRISPYDRPATGRQQEDQLTGSPVRSRATNNARGPHRLETGGPAEVEEDLFTHTANAQPPHGKARAASGDSPRSGNSSTRVQQALFEASVRRERELSEQQALFDEQSARDKARIAELQRLLQDPTRATADGIQILQRGQTAHPAPFHNGLGYNPAYSPRRRPTVTNQPRVTVRTDYSIAQARRRAEEAQQELSRLERA